MNDLKRELSKLSGVDMFNPKYRDVFKKYFPNDKEEDVNMEEERAKELDLVDDEIEGIEEVNPETEETTEDKVEDNSSDIDEVEEKVEDLAEDIDKAEDEREVDKIEEEKAEEPEIAEEKKEEVNQESEEIGKKIDESEDLFDARLELALIRSGVRDDKINSAKRLIKYELRDTHDLGKVGEILRDYPEWIKENKPMVAKFGMSVDDNEDDLTAEERRMKEMGIDPR